MMRIPTRLTAAGATVILTLALGIGTVLPAAASTDAPLGRSGHGAFVNKGFFCGLGFGGVTTDSHEVQTPSGSANLVCRGQIGPQPEAFKLDNLLCFTSYGPTTDAQIVVSRSGNVTLTCHFHSP
jgi:hypothetical protein